MPRSRRTPARMLIPATTCALVGASLLAVAAGASEAKAPTGPATLPAATFVAAPPPGSKGPDDITRLAVDGVDKGKPVVWVAYQNGINPDGTPGTPGGPTRSTVAGFDARTGALIAAIPVTGKVDGLTADEATGRLIATDNEDVNSALDVIDPRHGTVGTYRYQPDPAVNGNGGTDSIAIQDGRIYLAHSNPADATQAADFQATLDDATHTADLRPVFDDNAAATDAATGTSVQLALTDPDTNGVMPDASPVFGGQLATISQADGKIVFASHLPGTPHLTVLTATDSVRGNVPPLDGLAVATADRGTLYVVDAGSGAVSALDTRGWPAGTVFVGEPSDNHNPLVGTLDLSSGRVTSLANAFVSPKGLLFVPETGNGTGNGNGHDGEGEGRGGGD